MIVTCHQPNFFPWEPFFKKVQNADVLVLLNHVQYNRHQYQNRFKFNDSWCTMRVDKGNLSDLIQEKKYLNPSDDWMRIKQRIGFDWLEEFDSLINHNLAETNSKIIVKIVELLKLKTKVKHDTHHVSTNASENLLNICKRLGAKTYLSGPSGKKYLDIKMFSDAGIEVQFFSNSNLSANSDPIVKVLNAIRN